MTMHLQGKPHLKKIEHYLMEDSKLSWCPICSVPLSSLKQAYSHCMSKQHCEKLVRSQQQPGDSNSGQNNQGNGKRKVKLSAKFKLLSVIHLLIENWNLQKYSRQGYILPQIPQRKGLFAVSPASLLSDFNFIPRNYIMYQMYKSIRYFILYIYGYNCI